MPDGQPSNRVIFTGVLVDRVSLRESPAGIPIARFALDHQSEQIEAGVPRSQTLRLGVRATGKALCEGLGQLPAGTPLEVRGYLARTDQREDYKLILCARRITRLDTTEEHHQE